MRDSNVPLLAPFFFPDAFASVRKNPIKHTLPDGLASIGIRPDSLKLAVHDGLSDGIKTDRGGHMLTDLAVRKAAPRDKPYDLSDGGGLYASQCATNAVAARAIACFSSSSY